MLIYTDTLHKLMGMHAMDVLQCRYTDDQSDRPALYSEHFLQEAALRSRWSQRCEVGGILTYPWLSLPAQ